MKYRINSGALQNITGTSVALTNLSACTIEVYKPGDGSTSLDSEAQSITVTQAAKPTGLGKTDCTTTNNNNGTITGLDSGKKYEYKTTGDYTSAANNATSVTGLANGTYYVRVKATGTVLASPDSDALVIAAYVAPTIYGGITIGGTQLTSANVTALLGAGAAVTYNEATKTLTITANATPAGDVVIPSGVTLTVASGKTLTVSNGKTLTNNGTITGAGNVVNNGTLNNNGTISVSGTVTNSGTLTNNAGSMCGAITTSTGGTTTTIASDGTATVVTNDGSGEVTTTKYTVTVTSGTTNKPIAASGETVTVTAGAAPSGKTFDKWTSSTSGVTFASATSATTTFTMPESAVAVIAAYKASSTGGSTGGGSSSGSSSSGSSLGGSTPSAPTTTSNPNGSTTRTTMNMDGSTTAVTTAQDGSTGTVRSDARGSTVSAEAAPSARAVADAAAKGGAVTLPIVVKAAESAADAAPISVTLPRGSGSVKVEIPVENLTPGTVAVIVRPDGTEEIVKTSTTSDEGVVLTLDAGATVKIVDNTKPMKDVKGDEWYADNIAWATSHEVMNGMGDGDFSPDAEASRAQIAQLLFNLDGAEAPSDLVEFLDVHADDWFAESVTWAVENDVAHGKGDSFGANDPVSREQLAVMLYNYARYKGYDTTVSGSIAGFPDAGSVDGYARSALAWAVGVGLINGTTDENGNIVLNPQGSATRAQIAAIIERFCENVVR